MKRKSECVYKDDNHRPLKKNVSHQKIYGLKDYKFFIVDSMFSSIEQNVKNFINHNNDYNRDQLFSFGVDNLCMYLFFHKKLSCFEKLYSCFLSKVIEDEVETKKREEESQKDFQKRVYKKTSSFLHKKFDMDDFQTLKRFSLKSILKQVPIPLMFSLLMDSKIKEKVLPIVEKMIDMKEELTPDLNKGTFFMTYIDYFDNFLNVFRFIGQTNSMCMFHTELSQKFSCRSLSMFKSEFDFKIAKKVGTQCKKDNDFSKENKKCMLRKLEYEYVKKHIGSDFSFDEKFFNVQCESTYEQSLGFKEIFDIPENVLVRMCDLFEGTKDPFVDYALKSISFEKIKSILDFVLQNAIWFKIKQ